MGYFEMTSPESVGISSADLEAFLQAVEREGLELHRLMVLRNGRCAAKVTWEPYGEEDLHPLYSFSKSLTAAAIGFARQEGLLSLEERLVDLFPEDLPGEISENLAQCQIHHLLCMSCGHESELNSYSPQWRRDFFAHPFVHAPGTFFCYNTMGTNLLSAIVVKKTGQQVTQYLRERLFNPLGIGEVFAYCLPDDLHTQNGGGGMKMSLEDMGKFTQFMLQDGVWEGKPLLRDWYYARAGVKQMETRGDAAGHVDDWACGYGYQCWMGEAKGSFRADGAFGQFGLVFPEQQLCIITSAATEMTQTLLDLVEEHLLSRLSSVPLREGGEAFIRRLSLPVITSCKNPAWEEKLSSLLFEKGEGRMGSLRQLVGGAGLSEDFGERQIQTLRLGFDQDQVYFTCQEKGKEGEEALTLTLAAGRNHFAYSCLEGVTYGACARWRSLSCLEMEIRRRDAMSGVRLLMRFEGRRLSFETDETLMTLGGLGMTRRDLTDFFAREAGV